MEAILKCISDISKESDFFEGDMLFSADVTELPWFNDNDLYNRLVSTIDNFLEDNESEDIS